MSKDDKEFEMAMNVISAPHSISSNPEIKAARAWAKEVLSKRIGSTAVDSIVATKKYSALDAITPKEVFTSVMSGEITKEDVLADSRFKNCPTEDTTKLYKCILKVMSVIRNPMREK